MPYFRADIKLSKRRKQAIWGYCLLAMAALILIPDLIYNNDNSTGPGKYYFFRIIRIVVAVNAIFSGIGKIRQAKRIYYIDITESGVEWLGEYMDKPFKIEWSDLHWVKKDNRGAIIFSRASSFTASLSLQLYNSGEQENILEQVSSIAKQHAIPLVNF